MKTILLFTLLLVCGAATNRAETIYICDSPNAEKFHLVKDCRGLNNCKHQIISSTREAARQRGLTLCGWED